MKKILVALATAVVLVSCGSAPDTESASLLEVGGAPAAEDAAFSPEESTSVVTESSSAPDAADISGAAIDTECPVADVLDDIQPILAEAEPVSFDEAVLTSSPAEITLVWDMSDEAAAVAAKGDAPVQKAASPVKESKQPTAKKDTEAKQPQVAKSTPSKSASAPVEKAAPVAKAEATPVAVPVPSKDATPDTPSTGIIAMASPTRAGEKAIDLPILPPQLVPSTRPSPVFVMQYDPNDGVEKTSGLVAETEAPAVTSLDCLDTSSTLGNPDRALGNRAGSGEKVASDMGEGSGSKEHGIVLKTGQYLDVTYPGAGWVYLGEDKDEDGGKKIIFKGRKLGEADTQFTLRAQRAGEAVLHFYKNDVATRTYVDDYMTVVVSEEAALATDKHLKETKTQIAEAKHTPQPVAVAKAEPEKAVPEVENKKAATSVIASEAKQPPVATKKPAAPVAKTEPKATPAPVAKAEQAKATQPKAESKKAEPKSAPVAAKKPATPVTKVEPRDETPIKVTPAPVAKAAPVTHDAPALPSPFAAAPEASSPAATHASLAIPGDMNENALLQAARKAYNANRYSDCLTLLDAFFDKATKRFDEGLYLEGLALEAHSDAQNIKGAIDSYEILMKNWPASRLWNKARERSIYLKRMYIDIR